MTEYDLDPEERGQSGPPYAFDVEVDPIHGQPQYECEWCERKGTGTAAEHVDEYHDGDYPPPPRRGVALNRDAIRRLTDARLGRGLL